MNIEKLESLSHKLFLILFGVWALKMGTFQYLYGWHFGALSPIEHILSILIQIGAVGFILFSTYVLRAKHNSTRPHASVFGDKFVHSYGRAVFSKWKFSIYMRDGLGMWGILTIYLGMKERDSMSAYSQVRSLIGYATYKAKDEDGKEFTVRCISFLYFNFFKAIGD